MILDLRFLAGVALGATLGFLINPKAAEEVAVDISAIKRTLPSFRAAPSEPFKQTDWPTDDCANCELFRFAMWDFEAYGPKSEIRITRCISIDQLSLACEMRVKLSLVTELRTLEGVFQSNAHGWNLIAAKAVNRNTRVQS
ncbi:hypothetical protein HW571_26970 [Agrobacterium genomosp. 3]|uniref:hypothetical protein n=1 Tax=Agrobacterium tomkonis TaxID=1183410 RepID=UPI001CD88A69|nr:hypothetical protein [Agrobacterium tomkonis]MCA1879623.1 hypothetical protein [Agrobacterium tumefaciens]MCA1894841.1 hypothetical protein [Agrobacterium tomkonis]